MLVSSNQKGVACSDTHQRRIGWVEDLSRRDVRFRRKAQNDKCLGGLVAVNNNLFLEGRGERTHFCCMEDLVTTQEVKSGGLYEDRFSICALI